MIWRKFPKFGKSLLTVKIVWILDGGRKWTEVEEEGGG
jgi:hypothetical protein